MAENELLNLGHKTRWQRTRRALENPDCSHADLVAALTADIEGVCSGLPKALKKGPPLAALLRLSFGSFMQIQAVLAEFKEGNLARLINEARSLTKSNDPSAVAACAARLLTQRLVDQLDKRAGRQEHFRSRESRAKLVADATKVFRNYEGDLKLILECSLRDAPITPFKRRLPRVRRPSPKQLLNFSIVPPSSPEPQHAR